MADGWAYARCYTSEQERRDALGAWLHQYNHHRPHTACGNQPPFIDAAAAGRWIQNCRQRSLSVASILATGRTAGSYVDHATVTKTDPTPRPQSKIMFHPALIAWVDRAVCASLIMRVNAVVWLQPAPTPNAPNDTKAT